MKRLLIIAVSAFSGLAVSLVLISQADAAPNVAGESFSEAQAALSQAGLQGVMSTTFGDSVPQANCIVVRQETTLGSPFLGSSGNQGTMIAAGGKPRVLLSLDCNPHAK